MRERKESDLIEIKGQVCAALNIPDEPTNQVVAREFLHDPGVYYVSVHSHEKLVTTSYRFHPKEDGPIDIGPPASWMVTKVEYDDPPIGDRRRPLEA